MDPCKIPVIIRDIRNTNGSSPVGRIYEDWTLFNTDYEGWSDENKNYTKFLAYLKSLTKVCDDDDIKIVYFDEENEEIPIESDEELREAVQIAHILYKHCHSKLSIVIKKSEKDKLEVSDNAVKNKEKQKKMSCESASSFLLEDAADANVKTQGYKSEDGAGEVVNSVHINKHESPQKSKGTLGTIPKLDKLKVSDKGRETKDDIHKKLKEIKHDLAELKNEKCKCILKNDSETPLWFKNYLDQFKDELLCEIELLLEERLGSGEKKEPKVLLDEQPWDKRKPKVTVCGDVTNQSTSGLTRKTRKIMRKLDQLYEKERKLDQRFEKMESKKVKMWEKMAGNRISKLDCNPSVAYKMLSAGVSKCDTIYVQPLKEFSIVWQLTNLGTLTWTDKTEMLLCESNGLKPYVQRQTCPPLQPLGVGYVSVRFISPADEQTCVTRWLLFHMGRQFGPWIQAKVVVRKQTENEKSECDSKSLLNDKDEQDQLVKRLEAIALTKETFMKENNCTSSREDDLNESTAAACGSGADSTESFVVECSDEDGDDTFVVVPMPPCFFPDAPVDAVDPVPVKVKRKSVHFKEENTSKIINGAQEERNWALSGAAYNEMDGAVGGVEPNEPYHSIEGSVYMVDKAGKCFLINENDSSEVGSKKILNNNEIRDTKKEIDSEAIHVRNLKVSLVGDKPRKCTFVDINGQPFDSPAELSEKIYQDDPEYSTTNHFMCDGVTLDSTGMLRPIVGPSYNFHSHYQPINSPPTHPEFNAPFPYAIPPPIPPVVFPPPQMFQSFIPPPPPPPPAHVPGHPPPPPLNPFHAHSSFAAPPYINAHMPDHFNNIMPNWEFMNNHCYQPTPNVFLSKQATNTTEAANNLNQDKSANESKEDGTEEAAASDVAKSVRNQSKSKATKELSGVESANSSTSIGRKHKLNMFRMKKMKISSDCEAATSEKKKPIKLSEAKKSLYPKINSAVPTVENLSDFNNITIGGINTVATSDNAVASNDNLPINSVSVEVSQSNSSEDCKQAAPVNILPEGLMTGAINVAYSAYSTAVNAISNLRPRSDDMPVTDDEKLQRSLAVLHEMGFTNTARNIRLLKKYNYSVPETIENYCLNLGE